MDKRMTWEEFKAAVDAKLVALGVNQSVEIHCIETYKPEDGWITAAVYSQEPDGVERLYIE